MNFFKNCHFLSEPSHLFVLSDIKFKLGRNYNTFDSHLAKEKCGFTQWVGLFGVWLWLEWFINEHFLFKNMHPRQIMGPSLLAFILISLS